MDMPSPSKTDTTYSEINDTDEDNDYTSLRDRTPNQYAALNLTKGGTEHYTQLGDRTPNPYAALDLTKGGTEHYTQLGDRTPNPYAALDLTKGRTEHYTRLGDRTPKTYDTLNVTEDETENYLPLGDRTPNTYASLDIGHQSGDQSQTNGAPNRSCARKKIYLGLLTTAIPLLLIGSLVAIFILIGNKTVKDIDDCNPGLCGSNGTCVDGVNSYTCLCAHGLTGTNCEIRLTDCLDVLNFEHMANEGVYNVATWRTNGHIQVFCDMTTSGGGWTVFQNRHDWSVDFYRTFTEYENGFGHLQTEFWLGLKYIQEMTDQGMSELRIDLQDVNGTEAYETFSNFSLSNDSKYRLHIGNTTSSLNILDDRMRVVHNGQAFSTKDRDLDYISGNCAILFHSAWWYNDCSTADLNGPYLTHVTGMIYDSFIIGERLKTSRMMLRRVK